MGYGILLQMPSNKYKIFDSLIEGVQVINPEWKYIYVNDTVAIHGQYKREELLGYTMMEKYPGIETTEMFSFIRRCMTEGIPHQMVNEFNFPDGSKGYFELRIQAVNEGVLVLSFDVTKQKEAEKYLLSINSELDELVRQRTIELTAKNKELEQFAFIASHDLQEPMRTVANYIHIIEEDYSEVLDTTAVGYLASMNNAIERMNSLTKALLDYSRLGKCKEKTRVDCSGIIDHVLEDLSSLIQSSGTEIRKGSMPVLDVYEVELRQLFQNLITNAIKFRKKDIVPEIEITSALVGNKWKFSVRDNGIGIDSSCFEKIFQIFQRLHKREDYEGNGIGLANCKKIAELHGGEISVESELDKGSVFSFTIPYKQ